VHLSPIIGTKPRRGLNLSWAAWEPHVSSISVWVGRKGQVIQLEQGDVEKLLQNRHGVTG